MEQPNRSIEEIENDYWPDLGIYPTTLIENCHAYRKIQVGKLQIHQIIELLIQNIGPAILIPIMLEMMQKDILEEDNHDGSCFIESIDFFPKEIWQKHPEWYQAFMSLLISRKKEIESVWGWKRYERLLYKMQTL